MTPASNTAQELCHIAPKVTSYGGCVTANCLGTGTYTDAINELAATYLVTPAVAALEQALIAVA